MKKIYKRIMAFVLAFILCLNLNVFDAKAASVSVSATSSVSIGGSVTATITVSGGAYTLWVSYDSSVLQFNSGSGAVVNGGGGTVVISGTDSGTVTLSFSAIANGTSGISVSGEVINMNDPDNVQSVSDSASVTVSTPDTSSNNSGSGNSGGNSGGGSSTQETDSRSSNCILSSMEVSPGTLEPEFSPSTYEYTLRVEENVTEIAISAIPEDSKASTSVRGATEIEPGENTVEVIVTAENGAVKKYSINVIAGEILEDIVIEYDGMDYKIINSNEGLEAPEGFTETTIKYEKWDILAYTSPNGKITLVCLANKVNDKWFIYDETTGEFTLYKEYSSMYNRYIILPFPENAVFPEDFYETEVSVFGTKTKAYQSKDMDDADKYIIYGMNIDGDEGYYIFDSVEKTFMRYNLPVVATETDAVATATDANATKDKNGFLPDFLTEEIMFYIICGAGALLLILIICLIAFGTKIGKLNRKLDDADVQLAAANSKLSTDDELVLNEMISNHNEEEPYEENPEEILNEETVDSEVEENVEENSDINSEENEENVIDDTIEDNEIENSVEMPEEDNIQDSQDDNMEEPKEEEAEKSDTVSEIPVVDLNLDDVADYEEQAEEINTVINDNYNADEDSAF